MPAINSRKEYVENGYYHIYNRGVEKRKIFQDEQDYSVFLSYLKKKRGLKRVWDRFLPTVNWHRPQPPKRATCTQATTGRTIRLRAKTRGVLFRQQATGISMQGKIWPGIFRMLQALLRHG